MSNSTKVTLSILGDHHTVEYPLTGKFNVDNVACAIGACLKLGIDLDVVLEALKTARSVPGRMQYISSDTPSEFNVIVDYAHTPDALKKVIASAKDVTVGDVILVFGCEGNRDNGKRPIMGRISLDADKVVLTTDNTHMDDQFKINQEVLAGMLEIASSDDISLEGEGTGAMDAGTIGSGNEEMISKVTVIGDRKAAMEFAMSIASPGDTVLITGRGHEQYMEYGKKRVFFDDRIEAREAMEKILSNS